MAVEDGWFGPHAVIGDFLQRDKAVMKINPYGCVFLGRWFPFGVPLNQLQNGTTKKEHTHIDLGRLVHEVSCEKAAAKVDLARYLLQLRADPDARDDTAGNGLAVDRGPCGRVC